MRVYPDANCLVRFYLPLPESESAVERLTRRGASLSVTWLAEMEVLNAIERLVFETANGAGFKVNPQVAAAAQASFRQDLQDGVFLHRTHLPIEPLRTQFEALSLRHTARHGFRTYDLMHVASAIALGCDAFWSFDNKALRLAQLEGLATE